MRIKRGIISHRKHKKLLKSVSGYRMTKHRLIKVAKEAAFHAGQYAFAGRKHKKSDFRKIWINRISQAVRSQGLPYSEFILNLKQAKILIDRKILADLIINDKQTFLSIVDKANNI
ncbi:50S ribosomal protein L20 [Candidatus Gottesmanbacteria bacterium]|nr:50S ribosomal protein L20 [Candidatus Gottesmanbacteria bacterium]